MTKKPRFALVIATLLSLSPATASDFEEVVLVGTLCDLSELTGIEQETDSAAILLDSPFRAPSGESDSRHSYVRLYLPERIHVTWYNEYHGRAAEVHCVYLGTVSDGVTPDCGVSSVRLVEAIGSSTPNCSLKRTNQSLRD